MKVMRIFEFDGVGLVQELFRDFPFCN